MAYVDRVTALRPEVGQVDWGEALNTYLAAVEGALENLEITAQQTSAYAASVYVRATQSAALPADLPAGAFIVVPLNAA